MSAEGPTPTFNQPAQISVQLIQRQYVVMVEFRDVVRPDVGREIKLSSGSNSGLNFVQSETF